MNLKEFLRKFKTSSTYQKTLALVGLVSISIFHLLETPLFLSIMFALFVGLLMETIHCYCPTKIVKVLGIPFEVINWEAFKNQVPNLDYTEKYKFDSSNSIFTITGISLYLVIRLVIWFF